MRVLHIAAHLGAGAGKAIVGLAVSEQKNEHRIIITQIPEKTNHIEKCKEAGIEVLVCPSKESRIKEEKEADIIVIDWWNHPSIFEVLLELSGIDTRLIIWSHINGLKYPYLKAGFLKAFDACMLTSKASLCNELWTDADKKDINEKSELVYGMGDFKPEEFWAKTDYELKNGIRIGYVGSLDYAKLHPDFVKWIKQIALSDNRVKVYIAGDPVGDVVKDINDAKLNEQVEFLGFRTDIKELLPTFDIFIYLLNPTNFATTENAILEAMAAGLPLVATDGIVERNIIENGNDGVLVRDVDDFVTNVKSLINDKTLRERLGRKARQEAINAYSLSINVGRYEETIERVKGITKHKHDFTKLVGTTGYEWFLSGCDEIEQGILNNSVNCKDGTLEYSENVGKLKTLGQIFKGRAKGSISQFSEFAPKDLQLKQLVEMIAKEEG